MQRVVVSAIILTELFGFSVQFSGRACPLFLTISLDGKTTQDSHIEVNWGPNCFEHPEWIGVYTEHPAISAQRPLQRIDGIVGPIGKFRTILKLGELHFPGGWNHNSNITKPKVYPKGKCLPYYVAGFNGTELLSMECLKMQPNWMMAAKQLADLRLRRLFIPGTHSSGVYSGYPSELISDGFKDYLQLQQFNVWTQLVLGIRYLDLQIGFWRNKYAIISNDLNVRYLSTILKHIRSFVEKSGEAVIVDFSGFARYGFGANAQRHADFVRSLQRDLGDVLYLRNVSRIDDCSQLTLRAIKAQKGRLILLYPIEELPESERDSSFLCPCWQRYSTLTMENSEAIRYMSSLLGRQNNGTGIQNSGRIIWAIRTNRPDAIGGVESRDHTAVINHDFSTWLKSSWRLNANIVAMDLFASTDLVNLAIETNLQKAFRSSNENLIHFDIEAR